MRRHGPIGLLGRLLAILLLAMAAEFGASTLLYERASSFSVHEEAAEQLAENLVASVRILGAQAPAQREASARLLSSDHYRAFWSPVPPPPSPVSSELARMRAQIVAWEPSLDIAGLQLRLGAGRLIVGSLRLPDGSALVFRARERVYRWDAELGRVLLALVPAAAVLIAGMVAIRRTLRPLARLTRAAEGLGAEAHVHLPEEGTNEVRHLIRAFNAMGDRIHQLVADRTEALAAVGHDLRTPLARLRLRLDALDGEGAEAEIRSDLDEMATMLASLLAFLGGDDDPEPAQRIDLAVLVATIADRFADDGHDVRYEGPAHLDAIVRPSSVRRAVANLAENALSYAGAAEMSVAREGAMIRIAVRDRGPGIPPERLAEVRQPFVRLDEARARNTGGLGLGLAIVARAAAADGGTLHLANRDGGGLEAAILLPE